MSSNADPGFNGYVVLYWSGCRLGLYCKYRNTVALFVGDGFKMQKYRNTAVVFAPFWRGLRVNGGWRETNFWDVCKTQHFSFYPDIHAKHLGGGFKIQKYRNTAVVFAPFFGAQVSTFKKRTLGLPFSWAPDICAPGQLGPG